MIEVDREKGHALVLTVWHLYLQGQGDLTVELADGTVLPAVSGSKGGRDLDVAAVLCAYHPSMRAAELADSLTPAGDEVVLVGYPHGGPQRVKRGRLLHAGSPAQGTAVFSTRPEQGDSGGGVFRASDHKLIAVESTSDGSATGWVAARKFLDDRCCWLRPRRPCPPRPAPTQPPPAKELPPLGPDPGGVSPPPPAAGANGRDGVDGKPGANGRDGRDADGSRLAALEAEITRRLDARDAEAKRRLDAKELEITRLLEGRDVEIKELQRRLADSDGRAARLEKTLNGFKGVVHIRAVPVTQK